MDEELFRGPTPGTRTMADEAQHFADIYWQGLLRPRVQSVISVSVAPGEIAAAEVQYGSREHTYRIAWTEKTRHCPAGETVVTRLGN